MMREKIEKKGPNNEIKGGRMGSSKKASDHPRSFLPRNRAFPYTWNRVLFTQLAPPLSMHSCLAAASSVLSGRYKVPQPVSVSTPVSFTRRQEILNPNS